MIALGVISEAEVARAMGSARPFQQLNRLYITSRSRLAQSLNALVNRYAQGYDENFRPWLDVALGPIGEHDPPSITLEIQGCYRIEVPSLHKLPETIAAWACESFELINRCLVLCMLPGEMWRGEFGAGTDLFREEYELIKTEIGLENLEAIAERAKGEEFLFFSAAPVTLAEQLATARQSFDERPKWMELKRRTAPLKRAKQLRQQVAHYVRRHGRHPWCTYIQEVCAAIRNCYTNDSVFRRQQNAREQQLVKRQEMEVPMCLGLWINSGSACELYHAEGLFDSMNEGGEQAINRYALSELATPQLRRILDQTAIGIGLLLRAEGIDVQVQRARP